VAIKAFELAKELGMTSKKLLERCKSLGIELKSYQAQINDKQARMLRAMFPPPSPEEQARRAELARAKKAKAKPKAKKRAPKKKAPKKKAAKKGAAPPAAPAEAAEKAPAAKKAAGKKKTEGGKKAKKKEGPQAAEGARPLIEFHYAGEAGSTVAVETAEETEAPDEAKPIVPSLADLEIPKTRIEALLADRRWEKLGIVGRQRSARAQAAGRFGGRRRGRSRRRARGSTGGAARRTVAERPRGEVAITQPITVRKLSEKLGQRSNIIMAKLLEHGTAASINDSLPEETAQLVALEFDVDLKVRRERDLEEELEGLLKEPGPDTELAPRAPVITFLGHVDHGKTSLLDRIRATKVAEGEAGGITQHIGAYTVPLGSRFLTFIDTPGHEAFTEMRARGANVTDIVVLVVAADDGVMPQTEEAISHARAAGVPMVVALNKTDLPNANPARAKQQLAGLDLNPEEWGGPTGVVECSAVTGLGLDALLERISLEAEVLELRALPPRPAQGFVLESELTEDRGIVATVLVRDGTLRKGDVILSSHGYGRARGLYDFRGAPVEEAGPSIPVQVTGLSEVPDAGDRFYVLDDLDRAREIAQRRERLSREAARTRAPRLLTMESLAARLSAGETAELTIILKADVKGTLEAIVPQLAGVGGMLASVKIAHSGVGAVNASDVLLADASEGICIGFNVGVEPNARQMADDRGVEIRLHSVIYELIDEVRSILEGRLEPEKREVVTGHAEVRQIFRISRVGTIAGSYVLDGVIERSSRARVTRNGTVVFEGPVAGLRRFKDDTREVREGFECGIKIEGFDDVRVGDQIEVYRIEEVARTLDQG
jgi:translation initiation factor IF-2